MSPVSCEVMGRVTTALRKRFTFHGCNHVDTCFHLNRRRCRSFRTINFGTAVGRAEVVTLWHVFDWKSINTAILQYEPVDPVFTIGPLKSQIARFNR